MTSLKTPTATAFDEAVWCFEYNLDFIRSLTDTQLGEAVSLTNTWRLATVWFNNGDQYTPHLKSLLGWSDEAGTHPYPLDPSVETLLDRNAESSVEFVLFDAGLTEPTDGEVSYLEKLAGKLYDECSRIQTHYTRKPIDK